MDKLAKKTFQHLQNFCWYAGFSVSLRTNIKRNHTRTVVQKCSPLGHNQQFTCTKIVEKNLQACGTQTRTTTSNTICRLSLMCFHRICMHWNFSVSSETPTQCLHINLFALRFFSVNKYYLTACCDRNYFLSWYLHINLFSTDSFSKGS